MTEVSGSGELSWLLQSLGARVDHVRQAVVLSADGLTMGSSQGLDADDADHLSALAAGMQSLAGGASLEGRDALARYSRAFARLRAAALSPADSGELLRDMAAALPRA